jgi:hypothetical protein
MANHPLPSTIVPKPDPRRSPTYPQRVHIREKPHWQKLLADARARLEKASAERPAKTSPQADRLLIQMTGSVDQIADSVARLPMETGELYAEDRHRLEQAVATLKRLQDQWSKIA